MVETKENKTALVYPYPQRASEHVQHVNIFQDIAPIPLTNKEKAGLKAFEKPFFEKFKELKELETTTHVIYPDAFATKVGSRLFLAAYFEEGLREQIEGLAKKNNIDFEIPKNKREVYEAYFDDLTEIVDKEENFQEYCQNGVEFLRLQKRLKAKDQIILKGDLPQTLIDEERKVFDIDYIENIFFKIDLTLIPKRVRERLNRYSSDWEKDRIKEKLVNVQGDISRINNPKRIARLVDLDNYLNKLEGYRKMKLEIKDKRNELRAKSSNLNEAQQIVLDLYQRQINISIAGFYSKGRILKTQPRRNKKEEEIFVLIKGTKRQTKHDRFDLKKASRTLEKIDHFLKGTGLAIGENGLFETIPRRLIEYAEKRASEPTLTTSEEYKRYDKYNINAEQAKTLCNSILEQYGQQKDNKVWRAVVLEMKRTLTVKYKRKDVKIREVRIPKKFKRGLAETLKVLAHEVEGHVLRYINQEKVFKDELNLIEEFASGRSTVMAEAASMKIQEETRETMFGFKHKAMPYYYVILKEKRKGGGFKDCLKAHLEAKARREYNMTLEELLRDNSLFTKAFEEAYPRTLRIFRKSTPLDDTGGYLPTSYTLDYIEQELIAETLTQEEVKKTGLDKLLYIRGVDLYSAQDLIRLGMLDLSKVREPEMVVARKIWPKLKESLDKGMSLDEAIEELKNFL